MEDITAKKKPKRIPYGMMNFVAIREDNYYYVDKTRFIEKERIKRYKKHKPCLLAQQGLCNKE